jgi:hypothetical protein
MQEVRFTFALTKDEFRNVQWAFRWRHKTRFWSWFTVATFAESIVALGIWHQSGLLYFLLGTVVAVLNMYLIGWWTSRRDPDENDERFYIEKTVVISEEWLGINTSDGELRYRWSFIKTYLESRDFLIIVLPKRAIPEESRTSVVAWLRRTLEESRP